MIEVNVGVNDAGQRIDKFLTKKYKNLPLSMMYKLIRKKKITVNRKRVHENYVLSQGDLILIFAPDDLFSASGKRDISIIRSDIDIVYEDDNILIADKPSGLLVHSESNEGDDTLIDRIQAYLFKKGEFIPESENSFAPALCNRIDRNTEGLVIAAKNASALREMNEIIRLRLVEKTYLAAVHGVLEPKQGEISLFLEKDSKNNVVRVKNSKSNDNTKTAVTHYVTVDVTKDNKFSLLEIELITGRTHQIRVSMAHVGHPLLGDGKYAVNKDDRAIGYTSQALCAYSLKFSDLSKYTSLSYLSNKEFISHKPKFLELFK